jgi:Inovirus Gp2
MKQQEIAMRDSLEDFLNTMKDTNQYNQLQGLLTGNVLEGTPNAFALKKLFGLLPRYIKDTVYLDTANYHYSPEVEAFVDCLRECPPPIDTFFLVPICKRPIRSQSKARSSIDPLRDYLSGFLSLLHTKLLSRQVKLALVAQRKQANRGFKEMKRYIDTLFSICANQVVIRLDLGYTSGSNIALERFERDLTRFNEAMHSLPLFNGYKGHILKIEFGLTRGLHAHTLLFFDGSKRKGSSHAYLAKLMGEYWMNIIVKTNGYYWNVNDSEARYESLGASGIGIVNASDTVKLDNLKERVLAYLCRGKQHIKPRNKSKMRLIRRGEMPILKGKKRGAPRKKCC